MTVRRTVQSAVERFSEKNIETPFLDATVLLAEAMEMDKTKLFACFTDPVPEEPYKRFQTFLEQRLAGWPVSYIRRKKEFYGRTFYVDQRVLVPRPDTETMIDAALDVCREFPCPRILDLCSGSGCIAVTMACECAAHGIAVSVTASDISPDACEIGQKNAAAIYGKEIPFIQSDLFASLEGPFDLILSNPPYLAENEIEGFRKMQWPEPELALNGGPDGLNIVKQIIQKSVEYLARNGYLLLEAAPDQMDVITALMQKEDFADIQLIKDLGNQNRIIKARNRNG